LHYFSIKVLFSPNHNASLIWVLEQMKESEEAPSFNEKLEGNISSIPSEPLQLGCGVSDAKKMRESARQLANICSSVKSTENLLTKKTAATSSCKLPMNNYLGNIKGRKSNGCRLIRVTSKKDDPIQRQENRVRLQNIKQLRKGPKKNVTSETQLKDKIEDLKRQLNKARLRRIRRNRNVKLATVHIVIVVNRLPVQVVKREDGTFEFPIEPISLLSGVANAFYSSVTAMRHSVTWVGWPGRHFLKHEQTQVQKELRKKHMVPVFLDKSDSKLYYIGFSQNILWHLFHSRTLDAEMLKSGQKEWIAYKNVNQLFAQVAIEHSNEDSLFWVHDYQLLLVPYYLRTEQRSARIGFNLHIPFPSFEMYRVLPYRTTILQGVLSSNFVGFQTATYKRHFVDACQNVLKCNDANQLDNPNMCKQAVINDCGRQTTCMVVPMGIDPTFWLKSKDSEEVKERVRSLMESFRGRKVILGIDQLDHMKGLPNKFYALETFFEDNPSWIGKVVFVQIAVPSQHPHDESNEELRTLVHKLVGEINGRFGSVLNVPIHYLDQTLSDVSICALYMIADVCLVSSIRDGMNIVSYEFICCQDTDDPGVLILSEFTGSSRLLFDGSLKVNPWDVKEMANSILHSLEMPKWERKSLHERAYNFVMTNTACVWAEQCISKIVEVWKKTGMGNPIVPKELDCEVCLKSYHNASRRVIFIGLFGGLLQWSGGYTGERDQRFKNWGTGRFFRHAEIDVNLLSALENLQSDPRTTVIVITSQERRICERFLKSTDVWQIAENGFYLKKGAGEPWEMIADYSDPSQLSWIDETEKIMRKYAATMDKSWVQRNETAVSFFYGDCMNFFEGDADIEARVIMMKKEIREGPLYRRSSDMTKHLTGLEVAIEQFGKQILVRQHHRKKRAIVEKCLNDVLAKVHTHKQGNPDFVLCYGNFREDEDIFLRFEELNFKVNEIRAEKKMEPNLAAEIEYPEIKAKFWALKMGFSPVVNSEVTTKSISGDSNETSPEHDEHSVKLEEDMYPESATVLFPPHPQNAFTAAGEKQYRDRSWELPSDSSSQFHSSYQGPKIAELDWSAHTEVWTVCSQRRPSQARYYLVDSRKDDLFNFFVQLDEDSTSEDSFVE